MSYVVAIYGMAGKFAGAGVVVTQDLILTCAHVANIAFGRGSEEQARPADGSEFFVRFSGAHGTTLRAKLDLGLDAWAPAPATRARGADLCVLGLQGTLPDGVDIARLATIAAEPGLNVYASGYPSDWNEKSSEPQLDIAPATVLGADGHLWLLRGNQAAWMAAIETGRRGAGLIYTGFSGGPVAASGEVIAIVAQARIQLRDATAYAIPAAQFPARILRDNHAATKAHTGATVLDHSTGSRTYFETECSLEYKVEALRRLPEGPAVDPFEISLVIKMNFAMGADAVHAGELIGEANNLVLKALGHVPANRYRHIISPASIPNPHQVPLLNYWSAVFDQACFLGPRMVGALLLVATPASLSGAKEEIVELFARLEARG